MLIGQGLQKRVWVFIQAIDMRKSYDGLYGLIKSFHSNPLSGDLISLHLQGPEKGQGDLLGRQWPGHLDEEARAGEIRRRARSGHDEYERGFPVFRRRGLCKAAAFSSRSHESLRGLK